MGLSCCKYSPNDIEKDDLIDVLKNRPSMFDVADTRIFEYYRRNQTKFKKMLYEHLNIDELTIALSYLMSIKHVQDTKNYKLNIKRFNLLKKNNYKGTTLDLMSIDDKNNLNDFLFILFMYDISIKSEKDYDERKTHHEHTNSPIGISKRHHIIDNTHHYHKIHRNYGTSGHHISHHHNSNHHSHHSYSHHGLGGHHGFDGGHHG